MAASCCQPIGDWFCPEGRPSPIFSTFGIGINILAGVWGLIRLVVKSGECTNDSRLWLIFGLVNHFANVCFCFYIYHRFARKISDEGNSATKAAWKLLFYDWGSCCYMLFCIWLLVWLIIAGGKQTDGNPCASQLTVSFVLTIIYITVGIVLMILSVCLATCVDPRDKDQNQRQGYAGQPAVVAAQPVPMAQPAQPQHQPYGHPHQQQQQQPYGYAQQPYQQQQQPQYQQPYQQQPYRVTPPPAQNPNYR